MENLEAVEEDLVWEDPPRGRQTSGLPRTHPVGYWYKRLEPLMEFPGRWARIGECPTEYQVRYTTTNLKKIYRKPPGEWLIVQRTVIDKIFVKHHYIYACYLGPEETPAV